jgi:hypothetical protein
VSDTRFVLTVNLANHTIGEYNGTFGVHGRVPPGLVVFEQELSMKAKVTLLAGTFALVLLVPIAVAITGGWVDQNNTYSNVGCLVFAPPGSPPTVACSGTLIHPRVFLTAGHSVVYPLQHPEIIPYGHVSFAKYAFDPSTWHEVESLILHPGFTDNGYPNAPSLNDVGVMILKEPIYDLPLAKLPYAGFLDDLKAAHLLREPGEGGTPFTVVGYGNDQEFPPPQGIPADGWRRFGFAPYQALNQNWLRINGRISQDNGGTGNGDSGGPTFWVNDDGSLTLVAITSHGPAMGNCIQWRVDLPETLDFINQVIAGL